MNAPELELPNFTEHGYQAVRELGHSYHGGRATYKATATSPNQTLLEPREVVIKQFRFARKQSNWAGYKSLEREISILQKLDHPRIPKYLGTFDTDDGLCLVQEYLPHYRLDGLCCSPKNVMKVAKSILEILVYLQELNQPIAHRDINPRNILVDLDWNAYLVDFGLSKEFSQEASPTSDLAGTYGFQVERYRRYSPNYDLYGLGITLLCLLADTKAVDAEKVRDPSNYHRVNPVLKFELEGRGWLNLVKWIQGLINPVESRIRDAATALQYLNAMPNSPVRVASSPPPAKPKKVGLVPYFLGGLLGLGGYGGFLIVSKAADYIYYLSGASKRVDNAASLIRTKQCVECDLRGVNLRAADLADADLTGANLQGANLSGANLDGANLTQSNLEEANLHAARITDAVFQQANLKEANLAEVNGNASFFVGANLESASFEDAQMNSADMRSANMRKSNVKGAEFNNANLSGTDFRKVKVDYNASFDNANFERADMRDTDMDDIDNYVIIYPNGEKH